MPSIIPFEYEGKPVRVIQVDGEPWFVAADVCAVLDLENPTKAIMTLDADERALTSIQGNRGEREANIISEPGMWRLVMRSDKPQAKPFQRFVTHDVLPAIRKTGRFEAPNAPSLQIDEMIDRAVRKALAAQSRALPAPSKSTVPEYLMTTYEAIRKSGPNGVSRNTLITGGKLFVSGIVLSGQIWGGKQHDRDQKNQIQQHGETPLRPETPR
jgi:prophage antirepressor-like protein